MAQSDMRAGSSALPTQHNRLNALDWISLILMIVGGLNWGLVGALNLDLVATIFGSGSTASRIVYMLVGLAAIYGFILLARLGRGPR
jgi:uncharacterized membrane protein YuzA (DUF378 family)